MKPHVLALILSTAVASACLVHGRVDALACSSQADCEAPRLCEGGYCVVDETACPSECNGGCDLSASPPTCAVDGASGGDVACPPGYHCDITCSGDTCHDLDCSNAASCTITCTGDSACHNITCGTSDCLVTCSTASACHDVTCGSASPGTKDGRCGVTCATGGCHNITCTDACDCVVDGCTSGDCGILACPKAMGNTYCTGTGSNGVPCIDTTSGCSC